MERDGVYEETYVRIEEIIAAEKASGKDSVLDETTVRMVADRQLSDDQLIFIASLLGEINLKEEDIRNKLNALNQKMKGLRQRVDWVLAQLHGRQVDFQQIRSEVEQIMQESGNDNLLLVYRPTGMIDYELPLPNCFGPECEKILHLLEERQNSIRIEANNPHHWLPAPLRLTEEVTYHNLYSELQKDLKVFEKLFKRMDKKGSQKETINGTWSEEQE